MGLVTTHCAFWSYFAGFGKYLSQTLLGHQCFIAFLAPCCQVTYPQVAHVLALLCFLVFSSTSFAAAGTVLAEAGVGVCRLLPTGCFSLCFLQLRLLQ